MGGRKRKVSNDQSMDPAYIEKRKRNNLAVTKSREKSRALEAETTARVRQLKEENQLLERRVEVLGRELAFLKEMFVAYASGKGAAAQANADNRFSELAKDMTGPSANTRSADGTSSSTHSDSS